MKVSTPVGGKEDPATEGGGAGGRNARGLPAKCLGGGPVCRAWDPEETPIFWEPVNGILGYLFPLTSDAPAHGTANTGAGAPPPGCAA